MTEPRFTVRFFCPHCGVVVSSGKGYAVYDRGNRITISFANYAEALQRRDNIAALYARFGW